MQVVHTSAVIVNIAHVELVTDVNDYIQLHFSSGKARSLNISYSQFFEGRVETAVEEVIINQWSYINFVNVEWVEYKDNYMEFHFVSGMSHGWEFYNGRGFEAFGELLSYPRRRLELEGRNGYSNAN